MAAPLQLSRAGLTLIHRYILIFINTIFYMRNRRKSSFRGGLLEKLARAFVPISAFFLPVWNTCSFSSFTSHLAQSKLVSCQVQPLVLCT